jgi:hypothetical protein
MKIGFEFQIVPAVAVGIGLNKRCQRTTLEIVLLCLHIELYRKL